MSRSLEDRQTARRLKLLLTLASQNPHRVAVEKRFWRADFCAQFIDWCADRAFESSKIASELAAIALHAANETGNRHSIARALAFKGSAYRIEANDKLARHYLNLAREQASQCPCCLCDVDRQGGIFAEETGHSRQALELYDSAITFAHQTGNTDAVGRTLVSRGISLNKLGDFDRALDDEQKALQLLSTSSPKVFHLAAMINLGWILVDGTEAHFAQATSHLATFEKRLHGQRVPSIVRHKLKWLDGLILARLGERKRALEKLRNVRSALIRSRQDADAVALTADIVQIYLQTSSFRSIASIVRDSMLTIGNVAETQPILEKLVSFAHREMSGESQDCVLKIRTVLNVNMPSFISSLAQTPVAP